MGVLVAAGMISSASATTYYWDVNGTTAGFSTPVGTWNTANNFWNTDATGGSGGSVFNTTAAADDLIIPQSTTDTGTLTVSGTQNASSIAFAANIGPTVTMNGGAIIIGGTGAKIGIFQESTGANTIGTTALTLKSDITAFNFSNSSSGLLTINVVNGSAAGLQTVTVGASSTGGITLNGIIGNGSGGGTVALNISSSGTGVTILNKANTFTGGLTLTAGTLRATTSTGALGAGTLTLNGGTLEFANGAALAFNRNTTVGDVTIISGNNGNNTGYTYTLGTLAIGANTLNVQGGTMTSGNTAGLTFGATTLSGDAIFNVVNPASGGTTLTLGAVGGSFGITKTGSGTLLLAANNTHSGGITINAGTLLLNADNTYSGGTTINGGRLYFSSKTAMPATGNVAVNDGGVLSLPLGTADTVWSAGTSGVGTLGGLLAGVGGQTGSTVSFAGNVTVYLDVGADVTYGDIGNVGTSLSLWKAGASTLTLTGANTYSGLTTVSAGTLILSGSNSSAGGTTVSGGILQLNSAINGGLDSGTFTVGAGAVEALNVDRTISQAITLGATSPAASTFSGNYSITSLAQMSGGGAARVLANNITADKKLTFAGYNNGGSGNLTLQGTGTTIVDGGITRVTSGNLYINPGTGGTVILNGTTAYGDTVIGGTGRVIARAAGAASGFFQTSAGAQFNYVAAADVNMTGGFGSMDITGGTLANPTTFGFSVGASATSARIYTTSNLRVPGGANNYINVNVYGVPGVNRLAGVNTYTLITGAGGGSSQLDDGNYSLGTVFNNTDFTVASTLTKSTTGLFIVVTKATALTTAYWIGGLSGNTTVWAASTGISGGTGNWATSSGGSVQVLIPGAGADVTIDGSYVTAPTSTTLGADVHIKTLTLTNPSGLGILPDGFKLTITPGSSSTGITIDSGVTADSTIAANIGLGAAQTWTQNSANALTVNGVVSGANNLTKAGTGTITLSGINTYNGLTTVSAGTLLTTKAAALPGYNLASRVAVADGATLAVNVDAGGWTSAQIGTLLGATTAAFASGSKLGIDVTTSLTYANDIGTTLAGKGLVKSGAGTLTLSGNNSHSGGTTVNAGTLTMGHANALGSISAPLTVNGGTLDMGSQNLTVGNLTGTGGVISGTSGTRTLTIGQGDATGGNYRGSIQDGAGGTTALTKTGTGTLTLSGANTYTGITTINAGTLALGVDGALNTANNVELAGGTLSAGSFNNTLGTLNLTGSATIALGSGQLAFANSSALVATWSGDLILTGTLGATTLRFGTDANGLTPAQLAKITTDAGGAIIINAQGYLAVGDQPSLASSGFDDKRSGNTVGINIPVNYEVTFSKAMDATTVNSGDFGNAGTAAITVGTVTVTGNPAVFEVPVTVNSGATSGLTLVLRVNQNAELKDTVNQGLDTSSAIADDTEITVDAIAPTPVPPTLPADNATDVAITTDLVATFSENIAKGSGDIVITNLTDGTATTILVTDAQVTVVDDTKLTINPTDNLLAGKAYAVLIASGAVTDTPAGNPFAGITDPTVWNFVTESDTTPPTLAPGDFVDDRGGAAVRANVLVTYTVTFNELLDATTVTSADFGNASSATVTIGTVTPTTGSSSTFSVPVTATSGGTLRLQVNQDAVLEDLSGNDLVTTSAILDDTTITVFDQMTTVTWDIIPGTVGAGDSVITGGAGTWDTTLGNWTMDGGVNNIEWDNAYKDIALFGGAAGGAVVLDEAITVGGLKFDTAGYSITGSGGTLTFGTSGDIYTTADATISSTVLNGSAAINKTGAGTLTVSGSNATTTYSGQFTLSAGLLSLVPDSGNLKKWFGSLVLNSGILECKYWSVNQSTTSVTVGGDTTIQINRLAPDNNQQVVFTLGPLSIGSHKLNITKMTGRWDSHVALGNTTLTGNPVFDIKLASSGANPYLILANLSDSGSGRTITKDGPGNLTWGTITLSGAHEWINNGDATLTAGAVTGGANTLILSGNGAGLTTLTGGLTFSGAGGLVIGKSGTLGTTISGGTITLGGTGGITINNGSSLFTLGNASIGAAQSWINNSTTTASITGNLDLANKLTLAGGNFLFTGTNTGSGGIDLTGGNFIASVAGAFGPNTCTLSFKGGNLELRQATGTGGGTTFTGLFDAVTTGGTITISRTDNTGVATTHIAGTLAIGGNTLAVVASNIISGVNYGLTLGATTLSGNATFDVANNGAGIGTLTLGAISGGYGLTKGGAGTLVLGDNAHTGGTMVSAGTLTMNHANALGSTSGTLTVNDGTLDMGSQNLTVGNLTGTGGVISGTSGTRTLTIGQGDATGGNYQGAIQDGAGGTTALTKTGNGTLTLSGVNTYTGATTISAGTLALGAAGVLDTDNNVVLAGGTLSSGGFSNSLGTLSVSGTSTIDLGSGAGTLSFSGVGTWTGTLALTGTLGVTSLQIVGLTEDQLGDITWNSQPVIRNGNYVIPGERSGSVFKFR